VQAEKKDDYSFRAETPHMVLESMHLLWVQYAPDAYKESSDYSEKGWMNISSGELILWMEYLQTKSIPVQSFSSKELAFHKIILDNQFILDFANTINTPQNNELYPKYHNINTAYLEFGEDGIPLLSERQEYNSCKEILHYLKFPGLTDNAVASLKSSLRDDLPTKDYVVDNASSASSSAVQTSFAPPKNVKNFCSQLCIR